MYRAWKKGGSEVTGRARSPPTTVDLHRDVGEVPEVADKRFVVFGRLWLMRDHRKDHSEMVRAPLAIDGGRLPWWCRPFPLPR